MKITFLTPVLSSLIGIFLTSVLSYPSKPKKGKRLSPKKFYIKQKSFDFILAASTFGMFVCLGNRPEKFIFPGSLIHATAISASVPVSGSIKTYKNINSFSASMKDKNGKLLKWKERKKLLKEQIRQIKESKELSKGDKTVLVILSVVVAMLLLALVSSLSCSLSCNGADGAAALVGIGGTAVVIFLLIITIRGIYHGKHKQKQTDAPQDQGG
jgi:cell division protein FtsL